MATEQETGQLHGGRLAAKRLKAHGTSKLFTLSGGHLFSIYDGCREEGIDIVDTRHEQTAAFAAEGWAKATRQTGVAALTAGPGVTNAMSALGSALQNGSPLVALGGRAPAMRWGQGSLQEIDHVPFVAPLTRSARTVGSTADIPASLDAAFAAAQGPPSGPAFVDFPLDHVFMESDVDAGEPAQLLDHRALPAAEGTERAVELLRSAQRPVIMAGTGLYWAHGEDALRALAEELGVPVFVNGLGRGCLPADHELFFSRARGKGLKEADVALVVGVPMDFRLGFGQSFGEETQIVLLDSARTDRRPPRDPAVELYGGIPATLDAVREGAGGGPDRRGWVASLRELEDERRAGEQEELTDERAPLHPLRLYHELKGVLDRDAVVIGDGGDFVSYAGRVIDTYEPGCWVPSAAWARVPATRWPPSWPTPVARCACCWATARSGSRAWSSTRWCATGCPWWR
jgi:acetolactate synthase-1/2/3 large subunit